jgi:exodeoxyribonuclease-1
MRVYTIVVYDLFVYISEKVTPLKTYLFYDIETTGLNKAFDQILHFAAIRTDLNFKELNRYELIVKLNPDVIPSPEAMIVHRMKLSDISKGISEYEAIKKIHEWMNEPGTISLGYNTLQFDDEFLRFSFYRNLLPPYTHQYANQCCRMDIYPMTILYYLFKNLVIKWPEINERISLKLEDINNTNKFVSGCSHNAMVDVEATIALAKQLATERKMWDYVCGNFDKKTEQARLKKINTESALMVLGQFGFKQSYQSQVLHLGEHVHYKNQLLFLRLDDKDFSAATKENILALTFVVRKKLGETGVLFPLTEHYASRLDAERLALAHSNKQWLKANEPLFTFLSDHYRHYEYPVVPDIDVGASLYVNGFWTSEEATFCKEFHPAKPAKKSKMIESVKNPNLSTLAIRILGRHFPDSLNSEQAAYFSNYIAQINNNPTAPIIDYKGNARLTPRAALQKIAEVRKENVLDDEQRILLNDLEYILRTR